MPKVDPGNMELLKLFVCSIADVPDDEWSYFSGKLKERSYRKDQMLLMAGDAVSELFFVVKGLVRYYYLSSTGREFNKAFAKEGSFAGSISAIASGSPSRFYIQAVEDTRVLVLPVSLIREGYDRHPSWERVGRYMAETVALQKESREAAFMLDSAQTRYQSFMRDCPDIACRLPQYHIASYLGITEVSLSRIRNQR